MSPAVFAHGHLRLYLLNLLSEAPMHGYELIQALDERFGGTYTPSAGTIYPRLAKLAEEGLVTKTADGRKSIYAITTTGQLELEQRRGELAAIETDVTDSVRRLADEVRASVNDAMKSLRADLASAARTARTENPTPEASSPRTTSVDSRYRLQQAESALNDFRIDLRQSLRDRAQSDQLSAEAVSLLQARLLEVANEIRQALRVN